MSILFNTIRKVIYKTLATLRPVEIGPFILCYHSISQSNWDHAIDANVFKRQINFLFYKYKLLNLNSIKKILDGTAVNPKTPSFLLTFDDGYKDILSIKEFLKEKNIKPILFLIADNANADKTQLKNSLEFLTNDEIKLLIADGWEIGSHSSTHKNFWELTQADIQNEIFESKQILEKTFNTKIRAFSYPRGRYTPEIIDAVKKAGYEFVISMDDDEITKDTNPYLLPRIGINKSHDFGEFTTTILEPSIKFRRFVKSFAGGLVKKIL